MSLRAISELVVDLVPSSCAFDRYAGLGLPKIKSQDAVYRIVSIVNNRR